MEILSPGVLVKLLERMRSDKTKANDDENVLMLLQIRSIVPVLAEGDDDHLWPKQGFHLEVSDSSHTMYVSLPREQDNMVLCDELRLGQLIFVEKVEKGNPVPVLRGIRPVPGRFPCFGKPEDLVSVGDLLSVFEMGKKSREKFGSFSALKAGLNGNSRDCCESRNCDVNSQVSNVMKEFGRDSDFFSTTVLSSLSAPTIKRRSWNAVGVLGYLGSSRLGTKPTARRRSACASSIQSSKFDSSGGNSSSKTKTSKLVKTPNESRICIKSVKNCEVSLDQTLTFSCVKDKEMAESKTPWNLLPRNLTKLGKDVERCRDLAVLASVESLQEASTAEKLLKCLNTYSKLKSSKGKEKHQSVNLFFKLQQDLAQTRIVLQSFTNTTPSLRANDTDQNSQKSTVETLKLKVDGKKNAGLWIKASLASDLIPLSLPSFPTNATKKPSTASARKTKDTTGVIEKRIVGDAQVRFETEKVDNSQDWYKGGALCAVLELTNSLDGGCRKWFLGFAEKYLDEVKTKTKSLECSNSELAEMMCQVKKVGDWLEAIFEKESKVPILGNEDSQVVVEACGRLRIKIYEILLKQVERTVMALQQ